MLKGESLHGGFMNYSQNGCWVFPDKIEINDIHCYTEKLKSLDMSEMIRFDLKKTLNVHASFIGFLIMAKSQAEKKGCGLHLDISDELDNLFLMLKLKEYLLSEVKSNSVKSA